MIPLQGKGISVHIDQFEVATANHAGTARKK